MSNLLLFDIDGVLFDPEKFGKLIRAEFVKILNTSEEELIRANADYYAKLETTTDFNPREIASYIAEHFNADQKVLEQVFWENDEIYKGAIYQDVSETLKKLSWKHTLGIFSQGNEELQRRKLGAAGMKKYFKDEHIIISTRKLSDDAIELLPRDATLVDNKHDVVTALQKFANVIWLNRKTEDSDPEIRTIHSLHELITDN